MEIERTFVGLDVHARSVVACALDDRTGELSRARLVPENETVLAWLQQLQGPMAVVYEAGPMGYGLARFLTGRGVRCVVAAPSKLHRPSGDRVKTDAKDALLLARLLRLGEITSVTVRTWVVMSLMHSRLSTLPRWRAKRMSVGDRLVALLQGEYWSAYSARVELKRPTAELDELFDAMNELGRARVIAPTLLAALAPGATSPLRVAFLGASMGRNQAVGASCRE